MSHHRQPAVVHSERRAIWARIEARFPALSPAKIAAAADEDLRGAGLSAPKIRTLRAIAAAIEAGLLPLDALQDRPADEAHGLMTAVKGIGPWTADIYLLFCLGHPDAFPAGDLALQEAARALTCLKARPRDMEFLALAERWRPWRASPPRCCGRTTASSRRARARRFRALSGEVIRFTAENASERWSIFR